MTKGQFLDENFMLETSLAQQLYHNHAASLPIVDYHSGIRPETVWDDTPYQNVTQLWIDTDHMKKRVMRMNGVDVSRYASGKTSSWERFQCMAEVLPYAFGNPVYLLAHLELKTAFGIEQRIDPTTAREVYDACNALIAERRLSPRSVMHHYRVETVCTQNDPVDDLRRYAETKGETAMPRLLPSWNPGRSQDIEKDGFAAYVRRLGEVADVDIVRFADLLAALQRRHDYFGQMGCRMSDHQVDTFNDEPYTDSQIETIFSKAMRGLHLSQLETRQYKHCFLTRMAEMDYEADWTQQYHFEHLGEFLKCLDVKNKLARTILYNLNPQTSERVAMQVSDLQDSTCPGKIQLCQAGWLYWLPEVFNRYVGVVAASGLLSRCIGISTDSPSPLAYARHDYFRRLLCNKLANDVKAGWMPHDEDILVRMVEDICYHNARTYFGL